MMLARGLRRMAGSLDDNHVSSILPNYELVTELNLHSQLC